MNRRTRVLLVATNAAWASAVLALLGVLAARPAAADQRPAQPLTWRFPTHVKAGSGWSHGRLIADPPIVAAVVSAEVAPDGTVSPVKRQDAYVGADDDERVVDFIIDEARSYVTACGFQLKDGITYWDTKYMPLTVRRR